MGAQAARPPTPQRLQSWRRGERPTAGACERPPASRPAPPPAARPGPTCGRRRIKLSSPLASSSFFGVSLNPAPTDERDHTHTHTVHTRTVPAWLLSFFPPSSVPGPLLSPRAVPPELSPRRRLRGTKRP